MNIIITGGNSDIATYISMKLENSNFMVYRPSKEELDVTSELSVESYFASTPVDILINCAGTLYSSNIIDSCPKLWIRDINVNLIGTYLTCRMALIHNPKCRIINISSTAAFNAYNDWSSYCASKSGVLKISKALELDNFNVVTLCPGAIDTKIRKNLTIDNPNLMNLEEGCSPILDAINNAYSSGAVIFYRKNEFKILEN
ncbi:SDR family oxidoreductase [Providencia sp. PROV257]|uniref:SDR family oxidoreductase n=1 Tax=Providencia sp. PROV257 TaxID=2949945 RepID=UPI00234AEB3B|nr:SDR family oxidoreductase [Providencia sp. PROV257]